MKKTRLLMIGNSFSWNAYTFMKNIADSGIADFKVGDICYGGCSLEMHKNFFSDSQEVYGYEHTGRSSKGSCDIDYALKNDDWTHISVQQVSGLAGRYETYQPYLDYVVNYVKKRVPNAKIIVHQTWAYQHDSNHECFADYNCDQQLMFDSLKDAYFKAKKDIGAEFIVPSGEAFQLARASSIGDTLCEDGFHANVKGQYLAGGVFYEVVTGASIFDTTFKPSGVSDEEFEILRNCIHKACDMYGRDN